MALRPIHVSGFAQLPSVTVDARRDEAEMVLAVTSEALGQAGIDRSDVGFVCSGSSDYAMGRPFSFTMALDGIGPWPPIRESHVESDGAFAMYEAWVRLMHGDIDVALVYCYGKSTTTDIDRVLTLQLDPYTEAPLGVPPMALAALQARAMLDSGRFTEADFARVVARARQNGASNSYVPDAEALSEADLLSAATSMAPLRPHDAPLRTDAAAAIVLSAGGPGPRISGFAHRIEPMALGVRDLTVARSARLAAEAAGGVADADVAELHAPYSPQELLLVEALGLSDGCSINPSGGALLADTPMVSGLIRVGEAAARVRDGANKAVATATAGPCLQQNLVCVLEASS